MWVRAEPAAKCLFVHEIARSPILLICDRCLQFYKKKPSFGMLEPSLDMALPPPIFTYVPRNPALLSQKVIFKKTFAASVRLLCCYLSPDFDKTRLISAESRFITYDFSE